MNGNGDRPNWKAFVSLGVMFATTLSGWGLLLPVGPIPRLNWFVLVGLFAANVGSWLTKSPYNPLKEFTTSPGTEIDLSMIKKFNKPSGD